MLILSSFSNCLKVWSVNHTLLYEKSELMVFKNIKSLGEIPNN